MKDFVQYQEALAIKELGFDEPCFGWFASDRTLVKEVTEKTDFTLAPTYSQAFRWFREKGYRYTISSDCFDKNGMFYFEAWKHKQFTFDSGLVYSTYEEAELACLNKLIEIVKEQQK